MNNSEVNLLHEAASNGCDSDVELLISQCIPIDEANVCGWTPLMLAARNGFTSTVSLLLKHRAKVNVFNKLGLTPVAAAAGSGNVATVKALLEAGAVVDHAPLGTMGPSECEVMPLMIAAFYGHAAIVKLLLEGGASINQSSDIIGWTPLMLAACSGHDQIVQLLVEWGANVHKTDVCNKRAIDIAAMNMHMKVVALLENMAACAAGFGEQKEQQIFQAIRNGNILLLNSILQESAVSVNSIESDEGMTPLILASLLGQLEVVQILLSSGANLNSRDTANGWTALMHSVFRRHIEVVKYLVDKGADIFVQSHNGYTVLDLANQLDDSDAVVSVLTSKFSTAVNFKQPELISTATMMPLYSWGKGLTSEQSKDLFPKSPARLKEWLGNVGSRLQKPFPKGPNKPSHGSSAGIPNIKVDSVQILDDVFEDDVITESPKLMLSISSLKSPNRCLSDSLKKHNMSPVTPPLLSNITREDSLSDSPRKLSHSKKRKVGLSLMTPNLIKSYMKTHNTSFNQESENNQVKDSKGDSLSFVLHQKSLNDHIKVLKDNEVDLEVFKCMDENDFKEIGIQRTVSRERLLDVVQHLNKGRSS